MHNQESHDEKKQTLSPEKLKSMLEQYESLLNNARSRKERYETLMRRKSTKKWDAAKTATMVRRLSTANTEVERASAIVEQVLNQIQQVESTSQVTLTPDVLSNVL
jgi:DNA repair exonuclease SbcCD ATPase subunit